jgi:hypothetical protein
MISRPFWLNRIENAWRETPIVWLAGVRRAGKTTLAQSLGEERIAYINCDLPVTRDIVADPELFYRNCTKPVVDFLCSGLTLGRLWGCDPKCQYGTDGCGGDDQIEREKV